MEEASGISVSVSLMKELRSERGSCFPETTQVEVGLKTKYLDSNNGAHSDQAPTASPTKPSPIMTNSTADLVTTAVPRLLGSTSFAKITTLDAIVAASGLTPHSLPGRAVQAWTLMPHVVFRRKKR